MTGERVTNDERERSLAAQFRRFATLEARGASPLYERLALGVADDEGLLALAAQARPEQPAPNVLFASVHLLLLSGVRDDLAAFYPSITDPASARGDPFPHFRRFCHEHADAIAEVLRERRVQTNVVERCGLLLPAFGIIARRSGGKPLALVEVGASAGLNLLWDRYSFDYGGGVGGAAQHRRYASRQSCAEPRSHRFPGKRWRSLSAPASI